MDPVERPGGAPQGTPPRTRTQALFTANGRKAVLLRRGPKTHFNLITWDLAKDRFESGQWMKGSVGLWDLSPSGGKLIYVAEQYHPSAVLRREAEEEPGETFEPLVDRPPKLRPGRKLPRYMQPVTQGGGRRLPRRNTGAWTAISTPPYFTALALWPCAKWTGGGGFVSERVIFLNENEQGMVPVVKAAMPAGLRVLSSRAPTSGVTLRCSAYRPRYRFDAEHTGVWSALTGGGLALLDWYHPDGDDLLFCGGGKIYRLADWKDVEPEAYVSRARLLIDLTPDRFRLVPPPLRALRW